MCDACGHNGLCSGCAAGRSTACADEEIWSAPQTQMWRKMKNGTGKLLESNLRAVDVWQRNEIAPRAVRNTLDVQEIQALQPGNSIL